MPKHIPKKFYRLFWDTDNSKLDPSKYPYHVILRILDVGTPDSEKWLLKKFPKKLIIETLKKFRGFTYLKSAEKWKNFFKLDKKDMAVFDEYYLKHGRRVWPY